MARVRENNRQKTVLKYIQITLYYALVFLRKQGIRRLQTIKQETGDE